MIPLAIVFAEEVGGEIVDDGHQTDGHTLAILRAGIEIRQLAVQDAHAGTAAHTPFLMDDAALLVNLFRLQIQAAAPVAEDEEAGVDVRHVGRRHIVDVVHRLISGGIGVEVLSELHADALAILDQAVSGEVLAAVEGHVLQEVCQTALAFLFLYGAHLLRDVEVCLILRLLIVADVVGEPVFELSNLHFRVNGKLLHLCYCRSRHGCHEQEQDKFHLFH